MCSQKWFVVWLLAVNAFVFAGQKNEQDAFLVKNHQSDYCIVVSKSASQTTQFAAAELQTYIAKTTKVTLPIISDCVSGKKCLFVGAHEALPKEPRFSSSAYSDEAYAVFSWENNIVIIGGEPKNDQIRSSSEKYDNLGLLYGVYDFIEQFLGTRWYAPGELGECVEPKDDIVITGLPIEHKPPYFCRTTWPVLSEEATSQEFNTWFRRMKGYGSKTLNPNHSMDAFSQEHLDTPEIFALDANGKRIFGTCEFKTEGEKRVYQWSQFAQFCYSSPKLIELYVKAIDGWYHGGPEAIRNTFYFTPHDENFIYVVLPDNSGLNPCYCPDCARINAQPNGPSNLVWEFIGKTAKILKEKYPDKKVATLAYNEYVMPPDKNIEIPDNLIVRVCVRPPIIYFGSAAASDKSYGIIDAWLKRGVSLSVWQYHTNFSGNSVYPADIPHIIHDFYARYRGKMDSALLQPNYAYSKSKSTYVIGQFPRELLNLQFSMKSLWNPDYDVNAELERFYRLFFGPAAASMKNYFDITTTRWEKWPGSSVSGKGGNSVAGDPPATVLYTQIYPFSVVKELDGYIKSAQEQTAEGSIYRKRVDWYTKEMHEPFYKLSYAYSKDNNEKELTVYDANIAPVIDGDISDAAWETAERIHLFSASGPVAPVYPSYFQAAVKNEILYIAVKAQDPHFTDQTLNAVNRDGEVCADDSIELFVSPDAERPNSYYQMAINLNDVIYDVKCDNGVYDAKWNIDVQSVTKKMSGFWQMEMAIPLKGLGISKLDVGKKMQFNLCRNKNSGMGEYREMSQWIPTGESYHRPSLFGNLVYAKRPVFIETFNNPSAKLRYCQYIQNGLEKDSNGIFVEKKRSRPENITYQVEEGRLTIKTVFLPAPHRGLTDLVSFLVNGLENSSVSGKTQLKMKFRSSVPALDLALAYSYIDKNGKSCSDYVKAQCADDDWQVKSFDIRDGGQYAPERLEKGERFGEPDKFQTLIVYIYGKDFAAETPLSFEVEYIELR